MNKQAALRKLNNIANCLDEIPNNGVIGMCMCILKMQIEDIIKDLDEPVLNDYIVRTFNSKIIGDIELKYSRDVILVDDGKNTIVIQRKKLDEFIEALREIY